LKLPNVVHLVCEPPLRGILVAVALLAVAPVAWYSAYGPEGGVPEKWSWMELQAEEGPGMAPEWAVQSVSVADTFESTRLYLRVENTSDHSVRDTFFYTEIFDERGRFCFSALFGLTENSEGEDGPLKPGSERTLVSLSPGLAIAVAPHDIRVYPTARNPQGPGNAFVAPVRIRVPVRIWPGVIPVPAPAWTTLYLPPTRGQYDTPVVDLALAAADIDADGHLIGMRVLDALTPSVLDWVEKLEPHLLFASAMEDFTPAGGQALVLVRGVGLRKSSKRDAAFEPWENPWVQKFVLGVVGDEIPPVSVLRLYPCLSATPEHERSEAQAWAWVPDCLEYRADGTEWSPYIWKPLPLQ
jgi:hypothetical protein